METKSRKQQKNNKKSLHGLYVITPYVAQTRLSNSILIDQVRMAIAGGARLVQYRDKSHDHMKRTQLAEALRIVCADSRVLFVINDDLLLAAQVEADGVHIGAGDASLADARPRLGENAIIGVSCYNQLDLAQQAEVAGADYVAFGRFFPSVTKPGAVQASVETLVAAKKSLQIPVCCIGGITAENAKLLVGAGADMLAVIDGVFGQPDIRAAAALIADVIQ